MGNLRSATTSSSDVFQRKDLLLSFFSIPKPSYILFETFLSCKSSAGETVCPIDYDFKMEIVSADFATSLLLQQEQTITSVRLRNQIFDQDFVSPRFLLAIEAERRALIVISVDDSTETIGVVWAGMADA